MYKQEEKAIPLTSIRFKVTAFTVFYQNIYIVGSNQELGRWDFNKSLRLETSPEKYPIWESSEEIFVPESSQIQFKCIKINPNGEPIWQPLYTNRRFRIQQQDTILQMEFGNSHYFVHDIKQRYSDSSTTDSNRYEQNQFSEFGITDLESKLVKKCIFQVDKDKLKYKSIQNQSLNDFSKSKLSELRGIWYVRHYQILILLNKYHTHILNICYDYSSNPVQLKQIEKCKMVLFNETDSMKQYESYLIKLGFTTWTDKGSLIALNTYGLQILAVNRFTIDSVQEEKINISLLSSEWQRLGKLIQNAHKMFTRIIEDGLDKQNFANDGDALLIYGQPQLQNLSQSKKKKLKTICQNYCNSIIVTRHSRKELVKVFKEQISTFSIISFQDLLFYYNNEIIPLFEMDFNDLREVKERFLAQKTFNLIYDTPFAIILQHKFPRMFEVQKQFYETELLRYTKLRYSIGDSRIRIIMVDMNDILRNILKLKEYREVVLLGTDSILDEVDKSRFKMCRIKRVISLAQLQKFNKI